MKSSVFNDIHSKNHWGGSESVSGPGSDMNQTVVLRKILPIVFTLLGIQTILDAPCGDFNWMRHLDYQFEEYIGLDIVPELISSNHRTYATNKRRFILGDIVKDKLPRVDLIFCRDCLVHLHFEDSLEALERFRESGSVYLISTSFPTVTTNTENATWRMKDEKDEGSRLWFRTGDFRPINLQLPPFSLPAPIITIDEQHPTIYKTMGLWKL